MSDVVLRTLHLCSGYDGAELALRLAGVPTRTVAHVERDSHAAAALVARMEDEALDRAPVWSDLNTFDTAPWVGRVDLVTAGFPCQPFSAAGLKRGVVDDRWLWPGIARIIGDVGPRLVFLENVPQVVKHGLPYVLADLAALGFDAEWGLLSAAAVGAPHKRERFWLLAHADDDGLGVERRGGLLDRVGPPRGDDTHRSGGSDVADAAGLGGDERIGRSARRRGPVVEGDRFPPGPDDAIGWGRWTAQGGPQPSVRRSTDGRPVGLADALHLGGNGLVPLVAAHALAILATRLGIGRIEQR